MNKMWDDEEIAYVYARIRYGKSRGIYERAGNKNMAFLDESDERERVKLSSRQMDVTCCLETEVFHRKKVDAARYRKKEKAMQ